MKLGIFLDHVIETARQRGISVSEALGLAARLGYTYVEADVNAFAGKEDEWLRMLSDAGLETGGMYGFFDFAHAPEYDRAKRFVETAVKMRAECVMAIPGFIEDGDRIEDIFPRMSDRLNDIADLLEPTGIRLVLEDYDGASAVFGDLKGLTRMLTEVSKLGCAFDTGNFIFHGDGIEEAYEKLKDRIAHVHLKDRALTPEEGDAFITCMNGDKLYPCAVGSGIIGIYGVIDSLRRDGYGGIYAVEHFGAADMYGSMKASAERLIPQLM